MSRLSVRKAEVAMNEAPNSRAPAANSQAQGVAPGVRPLRLAHQLQPNQTANGMAISTPRRISSLSNGGSVKSVVEGAQYARGRAPDHPVLVGHGVEPTPLPVRQLAFALLVVARVHQEAER